MRTLTETNFDTVLLPALEKLNDTVEELKLTSKKGKKFVKRLSAVYEGVSEFFEEEDDDGVFSKSAKKKFSCSHCSEKFNSPYGIINHLNKKHNIKGKDAVIDGWTDKHEESYMKKFESKKKKSK